MNIKNIRAAVEQEEKYQREKKETEKIKAEAEALKAKLDSELKKEELSSFEGS